MNNKVLSIGWLLCVAIMGLVLSVQVSKGFQIETNVLALLPESEQDTVAENAVDILSEHIGQRMIFLVGSEDRDDARSAALELKQQLQDRLCFKSIHLYVDSSVHDRLQNTLFPYRHSLLAESTRNYLRLGQADKIIEAGKLALFSPMSGFNSQLLDVDPLFLFSEFSNSIQQNSGNVGFDADMLSIEQNNKYYVLIHAYLSGSSFSIQTQDCATNAIQSARENLQETYSGIDVKTAGLVRYAAAGTASARSEISTIGLGSLIAIIFIILFVFRSALPLLIGLLPIATGVLAALVFSSYIFEKVHLFTLVFGTSLIGISIDYSLHFLSDRLISKNAWDSQQGLRRIFIGISLGLASSIIGYMSFFAISFPGLTQIAVFSSTGLIAAYLTVVMWFPLLLARPSTTNHQSLDKGLATWLKLHDQFRRSKFFTPFVFAIAVIIIGGILLLEPNDDVRILQATPTHLKEEDRQISELIGRHDAAQFFLVESDNEQMLLETEETLREQLQNLINENKLSGYTALSVYVPSIKRQQQNRTLIKQGLFGENNRLESYMHELGFSESVIKNVKEYYLNDHQSFLTLDHVFNAFEEDGPIPEYLWMGKTTRGVASIVTLEGITDLELLRHIANGLPKVTFVNKIENISTMFKRYRVSSSFYIAGAYGLIFCLLMLRYRLRRAFIIFIPPVLAALLALAIQGYMGEPLNLFNSLALLLVLGIGIDYTLFFEEGDTSHRHSTLLAVTLSALTTMISFGLLALSSTQAIHGFGLTVLFGIGFAFLLSPIAGRSDTQLK